MLHSHAAGGPPPTPIPRSALWSVVGIMVDFAKAVPFCLERGAWDETTLPFVEGRLAETPCHAGRRWEEVIFPDKAAVASLTSRWGGA